MKVLTGTLLTLATGAGGLLTLPALGRATPAVHLVTSIQAVSHGHEQVRYAVTVRPAGGPAHMVTVVLGTRRPAAWTAAAPGCLSSPDRTTLACDLGDVREAQSRTLRLTAQPGDLADVPVIAHVRAANAPSVTSSLGTTRPIGLGLHGSGEAPGLRGGWEVPGTRGVVEPPRPRAEAPGPRRVGEPPADDPAAPEPSPAPPESPGTPESPLPSASPEPSGSAEPPQSPQPSQSPAGVSPAVVAPSGENAAPAESESAEPADSPPAQPPPAESPAAAGPPDRHAPPRHVPIRPAPYRGPAASPPGRPPHARSGPAVPRAPIIPHVPVSPGTGAGVLGAGVPGAGAQGAANPPPPAAPVPPPAAPVPPPDGLMGGPGGAPGKPPTSSPSPTLPEIAPQSSPGTGISELNTLSPASAMRAGRVSWATLIAVAVVAEAGLLWLVTGFAVWRRKRAPRHRARSRRAGWPRTVLSRSHQ